MGWGVVGGALGMDARADWTDHRSSGAAAVGGALETASRVSVGLEGGFEVALSGGEGGAGMVIR